jgi:hypothetical protein
MRTMQRDDVDQGSRGRGHGCCGGSGCCGDGHGSHSNREDEATMRRTSLEERQRDLEQELADVAGQLRNLRV